MKGLSPHEAARPVPGAHASTRTAVLLTATSFPSSPSDWKGLFILRMLESLSRRDDLAVAAWCPPGPLPMDVENSLYRDDAAWLERLANLGGIAHLLRSHPIKGTATAISLLRRLHRAYRASPADLIHVNWLQNALSLPADGRPALVTALGTDMRLLRLPGMRLLLRRSLRNRPVAICPNANWMLPELEAAFGDIAKIRVVPFGIDPGWYALQRKFDTNPIPKWLCVSRLTERKIGALFDWAAPAFSSGQAELHLFGPMQEQLALPPWAHWHGPTTPAILRDIWFPQAHGLITLSRHDEGRPQVMLEAMASGLPVIASHLPAHDDLLNDGGGVLCRTAQDTLAALAALSDPAENRAVGDLGRARMKDGFGTWEDCAQRYATLYAELRKERA